MIAWRQNNPHENPSQEALGIGLAIRLAGAAGQGITRFFLLTHSMLPRSPKALALGGSLILSAFFTSAALRLPDQHWLAWISFLPLFVVARSLRPFAAALAGGFWGGWLYLFCTTGATAGVDPITIAITPSPWLLALLIVIPAVYMGLAARPARAIGFKLLTLALGWTLIELVVHLHSPSGARESLLAGSAGEGLQLHWLARLLGYVCTAFFVACINASLVGLLSRARLSFPACRLFAGSPNVVGHLASQVILPIQSWTLRQAHPRAPPA